MSAHFLLPPEIVRYVGSSYTLDSPPQGTAFRVFVLSSDRGRFVLKIAHDSAMIAALHRETAILSALQDHIPFVAQPLMDVPLATGEHAFLFTYLEGEPLYLVLQQVSKPECERLLIQYAEVLRMIHSWEPDLPRPTDWLTETLSWLHAHIFACPPDAVVAHTNSRFDGMDARRLWSDLQDQRTSIANELVFGHYDYCLPNVLVHRQCVSGIIDWSGGGYIDRRFDLATALFSMQLMESLQESCYQSTFLLAYGYREPPETLTFFAALHALTCAFWQ